MVLFLFFSLSFFVTLCLSDWWMDTIPEHFRFEFSCDTRNVFAFSQQKEKRKEMMIKEMCRIATFDFKRHHESILFWNTHVLFILCSSACVCVCVCALCAYYMLTSAASQFRLLMFSPRFSCFFFFLSRLFACNKFCVTQFPMKWV